MILFKAGEDSPIHANY